MRKISFSMIPVFVLFSLSSLASTSTNDCTASNYSELIRCAEKQSSEIQISELQLLSAQKLEGVARQWSNPELDADTVSKGSEKSEANASLMFNLRLGGKKAALVNEAQSEMERAKVNRDLEVYQARLELMLSLYRLSHLKKEIYLETESIETFSKIIKQFQKRPALSPEQDVSLSVFKMSLADHQLRLAKLNSDEERIYQKLISLTGLSKSLFSKNLPPAKQIWPSVENISSVEEAPQVRLALADLKMAQIQKRKSETDSWPDIKIGPSIKIVKENGESTNLIGLGLSMPLPVFNQNGADRAYRAQKTLEAEMLSTQARKKLISARAELVKRYTQTVEVLKNSLSLSIVAEKHAELERQFFKGLVPSSLVIEAHRQIFDLEERRNSAELEALETLGQILIIDNKFNEVIL